MRTPILRLLSVILVVLPIRTYAQTPLDAGALQKQLEKERQNNFQPNNNIPSLENNPTLRKSKAVEKLKITVKTFRFSGNTLLSDRELAYAVKPYLNHPVSFNELQDAAATVGEAYRAKGWVVNSFLPKQNIVGGIVTIKIIEAKFGKTRIEGDTDIKLPAGRIDAMVAAQQKSDKPLNTQKLDRALLLIDDLPGIFAAGRLQAGDEASETDIIINQKKEALATGAVIMDNEGARSTGDKRAQGFTQILNPLGRGDQTSMYLLGSQGLVFARMEQTFPVGYDGLRLGGNASVMKYKVVPDEFKALDSNGSSSSFGMQASYPVIRARESNLYLNGNYDHKYFNNNSQEVVSSNYQIDDYTLTLNGNILDKLGGGGNSNASVGTTFGRVNLNALDTGENPELNNSFHKISYNISRQQALTSTISLSAMVSGQISPSRKLDSSEMFYLGGPMGVRAYPVSEGSGISGNMLNAELHWRFLPNYQLTGFFDHGYLRNTGDVKSYSLDGAGLALAWQSKSGFTIDGSWAYRIGNNPNPTTTGGDQDGSSIKNRFWITISKRF